MTNSEDATTVSTTEASEPEVDHLEVSTPSGESPTVSSTENGDSTTLMSSSSGSDDGHEPASETFDFPNNSHPLDAGHLKAERLAYFILFGTISIAVICTINFATIAIFWPPGLDTLLIAAASFLLFSLLIWFCFSFPKLQYDRTRWRVTEEGFEIRSGVIWKSIHVIPHDRVQHTDVTQGPLQRRYGVSTLTIHTAGTSNASVQLEGLAMSVASNLRDQLISRQNASKEECSQAAVVDSPSSDVAMPSLNHG